MKWLHLERSSLSPEGVQQSETDLVFHDGIYCLAAVVLDARLFVQNFFGSIVSTVENSELEYSSLVRATFTMIFSPGPLFRLRVQSCSWAALYLCIYNHKYSAMAGFLIDNNGIVQLGHDHSVQQRDTFLNP